MTIKITFNYISPFYPSFKQLHHGRLKVPVLSCFCLRRAGFSCSVKHCTGTPYLTKVHTVLGREKRALPALFFLPGRRSLAFPKTWFGGRRQTAGRPVLRKQGPGALEWPLAAREPTTPGNTKAQGSIMKFPTKAKKPG